MEGVPLKQLKTFNNEKLCIICQKNTSDKICSTENGWSQIIDAANMKQDEVNQRLQNLTGTFVYHMNYKCYKKYFHHQKTALTESPGSSAISCESEVSIENSFPTASSTRSNPTPQTPFTPVSDKYKTLCYMRVCLEKHIGEIL